MQLQMITKEYERQLCLLSHKLEEQLKEMTMRLCTMESAIKIRQDQMFLKQDQIQNTLVGEILNRGRGSNNTSVVGWSSPPIMSPRIRPSGHHSLPLSPEHSECATSHSGLCSAPLSDYDLESILSFDWSEAPTGALPDPLQGELPGDVPLAGPSPVPLAGPSPNVPLAGPSASLPLAGLSMTSLDEPQAGELLAGQLMTPQDELPADVPLAGSSPVVQCELVDPQSVIQSNISDCCLARVGRLAATLARCSFFGDEVLAESTMHGRGKVKQKLDRQKLNALIDAIHMQPAFSHMTRDEFLKMVQPKIMSAIVHLCKYMRKTKGKGNTI